MSMSAMRRGTSSVPVDMWKGQRLEVGGPRSVSFDSGKSVSSPLGQIESEQPEADARKLVTRSQHVGATVAPLRGAHC
jgi:hypothetical protein